MLLCALLASVLAAGTAGPPEGKPAAGKVELLWLGQSAVRITTPGGKVIVGFRIYHMGDTGLFGDRRLIGERHPPDLLLIPIGGHYVMDPQDAAFATREWLKPRFALPIHYGTNPQLKGTPEEYKRTLGDAPTKVLSLQPGESVSF